LRIANLGEPVENIVMPSHQSNSSGHRETRRSFIRKTTAATALLATTHFAPAAERIQAISLVLDPDDAEIKKTPMPYAIGALRDALSARGVTVQEYPRVSDAPRGQECVVVAGHSSAVADEALANARVTLPKSTEALALVRANLNGRAILLATGANAPGISHALLELADRVSLAEDFSSSLRSVEKIVEQPANAVRSVARLFTSDVEDKPWFNDREFWRVYLNELAMQRFNRFALTFGIGYDFTTDIRDCYFHFAYPFLLRVPGYDVRAVPLSNAERDSNLDMLKFISSETARRGLHFQLGLWTHAYKWTNSPNANYTIEGLTPEIHALYCRDALREVLVACPAISGVTFRIHGESGVPEASYDFWRTVFDGIVKCGRRVEIDMHAKGIDQQMIDVALATGMPVNVSPKFWAEHMGLGYMQGAIRPIEMPPRNANDSGFFAKSSGSRRFLRYGYGDLFRDDRKYGVLHRIWPGTQRLLLWGDYTTAEEYGRAASFCGSAGLELCEPLSFKGRKGSGLPGGRDAYADTSLRTKHDFEKFRYTYRVWGRSLFNPGGDKDYLTRFLQHEFGAAHEPIAYALKSAGGILPLITTAHCPSAANNNYWPEIYTNMPIVDAKRAHPYGDTLSPKNFSAVSSLDPEFFTRIDEFAEQLLRGEHDGKYSPATVARWLEDAAANAETYLRTAKFKVADATASGFRRVAADVTIQAGLGRFFAAKFRAGLLYAIYERCGEHAALKHALEEYRKARAAWAKFANEARSVYRSDITFGFDKHLRGHWLDRLGAIDDDIRDMEKVSTPASSQKFEEKKIKEAIDAAFEQPPRGPQPALTHFHGPQPKFTRGKPLLIEASLKDASHMPKLESIRLRYRRVNQGDTWQTTPMEIAGTNCRATIPADYTDSPFPLQYHFELRPVAGAPWLHPGLHSGWSPQPYFVVRQD